MDEKTKEFYDNLPDWGAPDASEISLEGFNELCKDAYELKGKIEALEEESKNYSEKLKKLQGKILAIMEQTDQTSYKGPFGTILRVKRFTVKHPKDPENKGKFFEYLENKGVLESMVTVNSQTLNSWYKQEMEAAVESGNVDFSVPGLEPPQYLEYLTMRKGN